MPDVYEGGECWHAARRWRSIAVDADGSCHQLEQCWVYVRTTADVSQSITSMSMLLVNASGWT